MSTLKEMLGSEKVTLEEITDHIEGLPHKYRIVQTRELGGKQQSKLWDIAKGSKPIDLSYLLPEGAPVLRPYPFEGKNSLPLFTHFQKVFYQQPDGTIAGYNNASTMKIVGPGYYLCDVDPKYPGEILVDYTRLPYVQPTGWPPITPNMAGLSRFVYGGTQDYLRWVSKDVVIGHATRGGEDMPNWFVLCRQEPIE